MDCRTALADAPPAQDTLSVQHAIFTSIPGPMGAGYRIVADTGGIRRDEKQDVLRRAPSHGSLCDSTEEATALASFPLSTGRHCVILSRHAGTEQTARGGLRVWTDVLILEAEEFERFGCNPIRVADLARPQLAEQPARAPRHPLKPFELPTPTDEVPSPSIRGGYDRVLQLLSLVLCDHKLLVSDTNQQAEVLSTVISGLPLATRRHFSCAAGMKPAPSRDFQLCVADVGLADVERATLDTEIKPFVWTSPPEAFGAKYETWLDFVHDRWLRRHFAELERIAGECDRDCSSDVLAKIALVSDALDQVPRMSSEELKRISREHGSNPTGSSNTIIARLRAQLVEAVEKRREQLQRLAREAAAAKKPLDG